MSLWIALVVLGAGTGIAFQMPMTALVAQRVGLAQSLLVVNLVGLVSVALVLVCRGTPMLEGWRSIPPWALVAGPLGMGAMAALAFAIPRIGIAPTLVLSIAAQLIVGLLLDRLGFLGCEVRALELPRLAGAALLALGAWLVAR